MPNKDKTREELEYAGIEAMIKIMAADISVNFAQVEASFKILGVKNDAEREATGIQLADILEEQKITNGRVTVQEKTTRLLKIMGENKGFTFIFLYGLFNILRHLTIENIIGWINLLL